MFQSFRTTLTITLILSAFALTGCDKAKEAADSAAESAKESVSDAAGKAVDAAKEAASSTVEKAKEVASETVDKAKDSASNAADQAKDKVAEITDSMTASDAPTATEMAAAPAADSAKGKEIYDSVCFACHAQGIAGAPKFGDKEAWAPRIAKGSDTLHDHAINGFTGESGAMMPAKGGRVDIADADIKAAVDYMVANGQ